MKTKNDIEYTLPFFVTPVIIPKGTAVVPADNLPDKGQYWAENWPGMTEQEKSHQRSYGFLLLESEVE